MPAESKPNMTFPGADGTDLGGFLVEKQGSTVGLVCLQYVYSLSSSQTPNTFTLPNNNNNLCDADARLSPLSPLPSSSLSFREWWGLNDQLKRLATTASESMGVTALVPDLYKGTVALEVKEAEHNMNVSLAPVYFLLPLSLCLTHTPRRALTGAEPWQTSAPPWRI